MLATDQRRLYERLRSSGWNARNAYRCAATIIPDPLAEIVSDLMDRDRATWTDGPFTMTATSEADNEWSEDYGTFTDDTGPDTIPAERQYHRAAYKRFRPQYSIAERIDDNRRAGMTRATAREAAYESARTDMLRAVDEDQRTLGATASMAGVELGSAYLGGCDLAADITMPYSVARTLTALWIAESLADLIAEATAEARKNAPRIAAELATVSA